MSTKALHFTRASAAVAVTIGYMLMTVHATTGMGISDKDRRTIVEHTKTSRDHLLEELRGLTPAQWTFRAGDDRWTIAEIVEHIVVAETRVVGLVTTELVKKPADTTSDRIDDAFIVEVTQNRSRRFNAPETIRPTGRWSTPDALLAEFGRVRSQTIAYLESTSDDLRGPTAIHPVLGKPFDAYQWLLVASAHTERHILQIREVKADARYPK